MRKNKIYCKVKLLNVSFTGDNKTYVLTDVCFYNGTPQKCTVNLLNAVVNNFLNLSFHPVSKNK